MFETNVPLSQYSNYKIGGKAKYFYQARGLDQLFKAIIKAKEINLPVFVLGEGTNLLISDQGFDGLVLKPEIGFLRRQDDFVEVGASVKMSDLLNFTAEKGLSGLEWAGGLPGTVGGAIRGNAGAFGGEIKDSILAVASLDTSNNLLVHRSKEDCLFNYRDSIFKQSGKEIILGAVFQLKSDDPQLIRKNIDEKIAYRLTRHPMDYPNIGSIFKNVDWQKLSPAHQITFQSKLKRDPFPILPTAVLIDRCGLKGVSCGGAMISPKHPNFIVNNLQANADDVKSLIKLVKETVKDKFGILLEEEIQYV